MAIWEQVLLGIAALILTFMFWPGLRSAMERSRAVANPDWKGALVPIGLVALFVILLIMLSRP